MAYRDPEPFDSDLERVRSQLKNLNKKIKRHLYYDETTIQKAGLRKSSATQKKPEEYTIEDMRDKLRVINEYLQRRLTDETVKTPAHELVQEAPEPQIIEQAEPAEITPDETTTLALPEIDQQDTPSTTERLGVGLDLGTAYLVSAREIESQKVFVKNERNAFLSVRSDAATKDLLEKLRIKYALLGDHMYVLGNLALNLAYLFNRDTQHSMSRGILNPSEAESIPIIKLIVQNVLWPPRQPYETCCFSIPANPIDREQDTIYHRGIFEGILKSIGYEPIVIDEGYAVVLSELGYRDFTGIGVSCGGGMVNVCASYKAVPVISFSITRGGDWIDMSAASVLGIPASKVTTFKEQGMNLKAPTTREEEAIAIYYRNYIRYFLEAIAKVFGTSVANSPEFKEPVDIVFAGGSALVGDFLDVVKEELKSVKLGLPIREVKLADEPFTSVTRGCLFHAINSHEGNK